jgi:hypothetical protein
MGASTQTRMIRQYDAMIIRIYDYIRILIAPINRYPQFEGVDLSLKHDYAKALRGRNRPQQ